MPIEGSYFLGINSGSYSFDNLFLTSSLSFFLESQETSGQLIFFVSQFYFVK